MNRKTNENVQTQNTKPAPRLSSNPRVTKASSALTKLPSKASQSLAKVRPFAPGPTTSLTSFPAKPKPSQKLTAIKITDCFLESTKASKSTSKGFQYYYHNCMIPCKINHGSITNKLIWEQNTDLLSLIKRDCI